MKQMQFTAVSFSTGADESLFCSEFLRITQCVVDIGDPNAMMVVLIVGGEQIEETDRIRSAGKGQQPGGCVRE